MVGIHCAGILAVAACVALAQWQWSRAHVETTGQASTVSGSIDELDPLRQFMPVASIGATTTVQGTWVPNSRIELGDRIPDGAQLSRAAGKQRGQQVIVEWSIPICTWISDALELQDGTVIQIVRGCALDPSTVEPVRGFATVTGVLQPSEDADVVFLPVVDDILTTDRVVGITGKTAHDGYIVAVQPAPGLQRVLPLMNGTPHVPLHWRNVFYVFNWLFFAGIVIAMWIRVVRDELNDDIELEVKAD